MREASDVLSGKARPRRWSLTPLRLLISIALSGAVAVWWYWPRWHELYPNYRLNLISMEEAGALAEFRELAASELIEPSLDFNQQVRALRREFESPSRGFGASQQQIQGLSKRIQSLKETSRKRQVPKTYERPYSEALQGLDLLLESLQNFEESLGQSSLDNRRQFMARSIRASGAARKHFIRAQAGLQTPHSPTFSSAKW